MEAAIPKNIVICCDGTGNEFGEDNSNVVKLYSTLIMDGRTQVGYYHPGAVSIDERRCYFRNNLWGKELPGQSIKQVWFAGVHSDVGGSYPPARCGLSQIALEWMLCEAAELGLLVDPSRAKR